MIFLSLFIVQQFLLLSGREPIILDLVSIIYIKKLFWKILFLPIQS